MRVNKFIASASNLSRRKADEAIAAGHVTINGKVAEQGQTVSVTDVVALQGHTLTAPVSNTTVMLNKPVGFVVSRSGQGSRTIYDLLPVEYHHLNPVGRLDKDSSGLLLLTDDGNLANQLTHPSYNKQKVYHVTLDKPLRPDDLGKIEQGVQLDDGHLSKLGISALETPESAYEVRLSEGRNRQIRRTFEALGYTVETLHRTQFGDYQLGSLRVGAYTPL